jgi:hypothetical protein
MKHLFFPVFIAWLLLIPLSNPAPALTRMSSDELQTEGKTRPSSTARQNIEKKEPAPVETIKPEAPAYTPRKKPGPVPLFTNIPEPSEAPPDTWIPDVGKLYIKDKLSDAELATLFTTLEKSLGIQADGRLDLIRAREAQAALSAYCENPDKEFSNIYFDDKQNLTGYTFIYFEMCTVHKDKQALRFKRYFENGFYPNRNMFTKEEYYYKSLYYYLLIAQDGLIRKITQTIDHLNKKPGTEPPFTKEDILTLDTTVKVCAELDEFRIKSAKVLDSPYERIFTREDRAGLNESIKYFTSIETHNALLSYPWFRANLPLSISAQVVAHDIRETWVEQTMAHRALLPLMLFTSQGNTGGGNTLQFNVDKLFNDTLNTLKLDNREVDMVAMSALKTWLSKQVEHGIKVEDRMKYKDLLDELNVCPTGWVFYNLYGCRKPLEELKKFARSWDSYPVKKRNELFNTKVNALYAEAMDRITLVFSDLEKLFGPVQGIGNDQHSTSINHVFFRYRGEINYYFEYLQFGLYEKNVSSIRFPLANSRKNCLMDFKAAFMNDTGKRINHENLLNAYDLLFKELASQGKISEIMKYEDELESFIRNDTYRLGSLVNHEDDDRYNIYRVIANSYMSNKQLQVRALQVAERSYTLARNYYVTAARSAGYIQGQIPGALNNKCTEIDDFERQFEFYQDVALKLGKKIWLLLPGEDIELYNRLQALRNPEGLLL